MNCYKSKQAILDKSSGGKTAGQGEINIDILSDHNLETKQKDDSDTESDAEISRGDNWSGRMGLFGAINHFEGLEKYI